MSWRPGKIVLNRWNKIVIHKWVMTLVNITCHSNISDTAVKVLNQIIWYPNSRQRIYRGFWDTLYIRNAMLTTLFRSQVMDVTVNALIEVNAISRARIKIDRPTPSSRYRHRIFSSPHRWSHEALSLSFSPPPPFCSDSFASRSTSSRILCTSVVLRDVRSELPPPGYCTRLPSRMEIFSREEKVGRRTETEVRVSLWTWRDTRKGHALIICELLSRMSPPMDVAETIKSGP